MKTAVTVKDEDSWVYVVGGRKRLRRHTRAVATPSVYARLGYGKYQHCLGFLITHLTQTIEK